VKRACLVLLLTIVLAGLGSGPAAALPGDPPVAPIAPAPGASLPTNPAGIQVSYACPIYRTQDFGEGNVRYGDERDYVVMMSSSPQLDGEGRLASPVARVTGASNPADPNTCTVALGNSEATSVPQSTPGTWYWQVSRLCAMCSPPFETGPVQSFTLLSTSKPVLRLPAKAFGGYRFIATVRLGDGAPAGTEVVLERRQGKGWKRAGTGAVAGTAAELTAVLPAGSVRVRARLTVGGQTLTSAEKTIRVRSRGWPANQVEAGVWRGSGVTAFRVVGRKILELRVPVTLLCPSVGAGGQFTTQAATALVGRTRIAPDGSFVAIGLRSGQSVRIRGRLSGGSLQGGLAEMSLGPCVGSAKFSAAPTS
jgi:hypothetical protein